MAVVLPPEPHDESHVDEHSIHDLIDRVARLEEGKAEKEHTHDEYASREHTHPASEVYGIEEAQNVEYATKDDVAALEDYIDDVIVSLDEDLTEGMGEEPHTEIAPSQENEEMKEEKSKLRVFW